MAKGVLVDITRCIACRSCQVSCKAWHGLPADYRPSDGRYTSPESLDATDYTFVNFIENSGSDVVWKFVKEQCMHCKDPACVSACPVGALQKTKEGPVVYNQWKCIGCRYCMIACPFNVPKYEWNTTNPWVRKCDFCADRLAAGDKPACVSACPMEVMYFDDYEKVVAEAKRRINTYPEKYVNKIYGLKEAGGTSWIYISDVPFEELGFNTSISPVPYPSRTWGPDLSKILWEEAGLLAILCGILYIRTRRNQKEEER